MMECLGPHCAAMILEWLREHAANRSDTPTNAAAAAAVQGVLWTVAPYVEDAPAITSTRELAGAIEHLHYAVFRRYSNSLTRAERSRLDNSIDNASFKIDRFLAQAQPADVARFEDDVHALRQSVRDGRERLERQVHMARAPISNSPSSRR